MVNRLLNARRLLFLKPIFTCLGSFKKTSQLDALSAITSKSWKFGDPTPEPVNVHHEPGRLLRRVGQRPHVAH